MHALCCISNVWLHVVCYVDVDNSDINARLASAYGLPNGSWFGLEDFNYRSDALTNITFSYLRNTSFNGITVSIWQHSWIKTVMIAWFQCLWYYNNYDLCREMSRLMKMGFAQKATPLFFNSELVNQIMHLYYSLHIFKIRNHHGMSVYIYEVPRTNY